MGMWSNNLQPARFKNVGFEVLAIADSNGKALAEHGRPFAAGTDLEDMGTIGRQCQMSAVFFGQGFDTRLVKLLNVLEEIGAGTLIHPILGVMPDMIAASWTFKTEADNINYVAIEITFKESKESQPIFVFENAFLSQIEQILNTLDRYTQQLLSFVDTIMNIKNGVSSLWGAAQGLYAALRAVYTSVRSFFDLDALRYGGGSGSFNHKRFKQDVSQQTRELAGMIQEGLTADADHGSASLNTRQRYDLIAARTDQVSALPTEILADGRTGQKIAPAQMQPIAQAVQLITLNVLISITVDLIENDSDTVTANELMHINNDLRRRIQKLIDELRAAYVQAAQAKSLDDSNIYTEATATIGLLKDAAAEFNAVVIAIINQKPPLRVKRAGISGTMHQLAHALYQDHARAAELQRLNPHITHPAFIKMSDWINYYAK